jgi:uncharacterized protein with FMN-binding domain
MQIRGARITVAAFSGLALAGALAGCAQSVDATVSGPPKSSSATRAVAAEPTPSASPTPTAAPTTVAAAPAAPTKAAAPAPTSAPSTSPSPSPSATPSAPASVYKDGNYSATGTYKSPGGSETLRVTLDLSDDVVTDLAVTSVKIDSTAAAYEAAFEGGIQAIVVGKNIDSLNVGPVAGSSLTSVGFNRAITTIKGLAKN